MDASNSRNRNTIGNEVQHHQVSEGRAALDDDILCAELSRRPTPIPIPRRAGGIVTYPTFHEAESLATDAVDESRVDNCCSRAHNQRTGNYHNIYFSDMARSDHSEILGYRLVHIITRFGERDLFSRLHLSVTELFTRHVSCHMAQHNHFLEQVPSFGCGKLFSSIKTFQRKYFTQYSSFVCPSCEQISIRRPGPEHICNRCDNDLFCSDAVDANPVKPAESTTATDSPCLPEINLNVETFVGSSSSQTKITTEIVELTSSGDGDHHNNKPVTGECVQCLDRAVNGPGNEFHQWGEANWYHNQELTSTNIYRKGQRIYTSRQES